MEERHEFPAIRTCLTTGLPAPALRPFLGGNAGDCGDVVACLYRKHSGAGEPAADPRRPRIIGRRGKAKIAELVFELAQELR